MFLVKDVYKRQVPDHAHVDSGLRRPAKQHLENAPVSVRPASGSLEEDAELASIFERTYGPSKRRELFRTPAEKPPEYHFEPAGPEYLLVDGYNVIFAWDCLLYTSRCV